MDKQGEIVQIDGEIFLIHTLYMFWFSSFFLCRSVRPGLVGFPEYVQGDFFYPFFVLIQTCISHCACDDVVPTFVHTCKFSLLRR